MTNSLKRPIFVASVLGGLSLGLAANEAAAQYSDPYVRGSRGGYDNVYKGRTPGPSRDYTGMIVGGWMVEPSVFVGTVYNSNINQTSTNRVSGWGARVVPSVWASLDSGIHRTDLYGLVDYQYYDASGAIDQSRVNAKAGVSQMYSPTADFAARFYLDYTRQQDVFGSGSFAPVASPLSSAPYLPIVRQTTVAPQALPPTYNQFSGGGSVFKSFGPAFVAGGFDISYTNFNDVPGSGFDGTIYTVATRAGFRVTPQIYVFIDPSLDWRRYSDTTRDSHGYRITGGVGTDRSGLWQGEIFGGYQQQDNDVMGTYSGDIIGARLWYSPTRDLTLNATVDQTLGSASIIGPNGTASRVNTALLNVSYSGLPVGWTAKGRVGFVRTTVINTPRADDSWLVGANLGYAIWRNLGLMLDYQYKDTQSNTVGQSFDQHVVSVGMAYKY